MKISREEVLRVAALAHLKIEDAEIDVYTAKFNGILSHIEKLNALKTDNVPPTTGGLLETATPMRDDVCQPSLPVDEALRNAPARLAGFLLVPKVVDS